MASFIMRRRLTDADGLIFDRKETGCETSESYSEIYVRDLLDLTPDRMYGFPSKDILFIIGLQLTTSIVKICMSFENGRRHSTVLRDSPLYL